MKTSEKIARIRIFCVRIDPETGEWIGKAVDTGKRIARGAWNLLQDRDGVHFDMWERPIDSDDPQNTETVALKAVWGAEADQQIV